MGLMQMPTVSGEGQAQVYIHHPPGRSVRTAARQEVNAKANVWMRMRSMDINMDMNIDMDMDGYTMMPLDYGWVVFFAFCEWILCETVRSFCNLMNM